MVVELLKKQENFTNSEKQVAEYLLKNPFYVSNLNASELGDRTYTSKATVFRLCKKIGIYSFEELKKALDREMREKEHLDSLLAKEPFHKNSSIADIVNILPSFYDTAINNTKLRINQNSIARIVRQINEAEKIDIYSSGITSTCAKTAQCTPNPKEKFVDEKVMEPIFSQLKDTVWTPVSLANQGDLKAPMTNGKYEVYMRFDSNCRVNGKAGDNLFGGNPSITKSGNDGAKLQV